MDQTKPVSPLQHVFVSYSRADSRTVDAIVSRLKSDGFKVWIDREAIKVGERWGEEIVKAVDNAYAFLLMLSPSAVASRYVQDEAYLAYVANKDFVPILLAPVEISGDLRLPLARPQRIKYYSDPEAKYAELVKVLQSRKPKSTSTMRAVGLVLQGLNRFNFGAEKQEQLLDSIANFTGTPRAEFEITKPIDMSGHIVVKMPADAAYRLKTAALNCDVRLIKYGIKGLRLAGDRYFVLVKSGHFAPLRAGNLGGGWFIAVSAIVIAIVMSLVSILSALSPSLSSITITNTPTVTNTFTPMPSQTHLRTPTIILSAAPSVPNFTLDMNANCREGPSLVFEHLYDLFQNEIVNIVGRNAENSWYLIEKTNGDRCWVWIPTGRTDGNVTAVPVLVVPTPNFPPPPPQSVRIERFGQPLHVGQSLESHDFSVGCDGPVSLNWDVPPDTSGIESYEIMLADSGDVILKVTVSHPQKSFDISSYLLDYCGSVFEARVRAMDPEGAWSDWSEPIYFEAD